MNQPNLQNRTIFCLDNIEVLKGINSNSIDLIYLDPPFNKNDTFITKQNKNIEKIKNFFLEEQQKHSRFPDENFKEVFKEDSASFKDIWTENDINDFYYTEIDKHNNGLVSYLDSIKSFAVKGGFYYLIYMTIRLIEIKRILKETGSIYLHCDPTFSHYLKVIMDRIFGVENFRNEIVWCYRGAGYPKKDFGKRHDIIYRYSKSDNYIFNIDNVREEYAEATKERFKHYIGNKRGGLDFGEQALNPKGKHPDDWWQIQPIAPSSKERVGYPTQKPLALLERIINASSNEGDVVLDPFCGCATTSIAAETLGRKWIGIDWNKQSFYMIYYRAYTMDILGTEDAPTLFGHLNQAIIPPQRTDISSETLLKIEKEFKDKEKIKKSKKVRMSTDDKKIAKELLYEHQRGMCDGCDVYMRSVDLTIDHITPRANEGDDDLDNLQLLCYRCNNWKRTNDMQYLFNKLYEEKIITLGTYQKQVGKIG